MSPPGNFSSEQFIAVLALVGIVILVAALLSGFIDRSRLPQVAVFLGLGAVLGPAGLGMLQVNLESPVLRVVATLCLALVLFTDAVTIDVAEMRRQGKLALIVLGPGTLLTAALVSLAAWRILGLPPAAAAILGAALASTDPVLLRGILRSRFLPDTARQILRLEGGLNDIVLFPIVLVAMAFLGDMASTNPAGWSRLAIELLLLGPGAGIAVGLLSVAALDLIRRQFGVLRDYESLYALGTAFAAFAAAEAVHGSGFLAAFAAGLTISALDVELCDCFLEYGQTTAEMALLFAFVLLGASLIWSGFAVIGPATLLFAAVAILVRPVVYLVSLARTSLSKRERVFISWFGPRGLSSLLLVLLPAFAGLPGAEYLFAVCSLVVLVSLILHGGSPLLLPGASRRIASHAAATAPPVQQGLSPLPSRPDLPILEQPAMAAEADEEPAGDSPIRLVDADRISIDELRRLWSAGDPVVLLDTRTERSYRRDNLQAVGAIRLPPDHVVDRAAELELPRDAWIVLYCT